MTKMIFIAHGAGKEINLKSAVANKIKSKKVVISSSASQIEAIEKWMKYWEDEVCEII